MKRIFIGGTGRSGTTILLHALYKHQDLYAVPIETKFLVEVDGLSTLCDQLSTDFSITHAPVALSRFRTLMSEVLTGTGPNPYSAAYGKQAHVLPSLFANYEDALEAFFSAVHPQYTARHDLLVHCRQLVETLFTVRASELGKSGWVEKTPSNIARIEFLWELYPDAYFVNCVRDPRGVLHSLQKKGWIVPDLAQAAHFLERYFEFIAAKREWALRSGHRFIDVKLESVVAAPAEEMARLTSFLGLPDFAPASREYLDQKLREGSIRWSAEQNRYADAWETEYGSQQRETISTILKDWIAHYGYALTPSSQGSASELAA